MTLLCPRYEGELNENSEPRLLQLLLQGSAANANGKEEKRGCGHTAPTRGDPLNGTTDTTPQRAVRYRRMGWERWEIGKTEKKRIEFFFFFFPGVGETGNRVGLSHRRKPAPSSEH